MVALAPLLETKLHVPRARPGLVARPRLVERLERGAASALTLISAPAGFGKSTLLAGWLGAAAGERSAARSVAWLSLDQADDEPEAFWSYVFAAIGTVVDRVAATSAVLSGPQPPPMRELLTVLLNDLGALEDELVLVLDDYHVITSLEVHEGMVFLLDHLPPRLHLVIGSRADPPFPLARLRARGDLVEVRAADLRFTPGEAATYLTGVMALPLTDDDVAALEARTEGWIAALQLAALSLQGRADAAGFIAGFAGDDRYIVDYLVEEVLRRQPSHVQEFLLRTAILERLSGPLCDALTGLRDGAATLEALDRANLFLVPLDDRRRWYRYHHLFADVLHARVLEALPDEVPHLHRRASAWYSQHGEVAAAIRHALAAQDFGAAADLIEPVVPVMRQERREVALRGWLAQLPDELFRVRPVLALAQAGALLSTGEVEGVERRLRDAEWWFQEPGQGSSPGGPGRGAMVVVDQQEGARLPAFIAVYRAALAMALGDPAATVTHARHALDLLDEDDHFRRGSAAALLGLARWGEGRLDAAHRSYVECSTNLTRAGYLSDVVGCAVTLADIRITQGRLGDALRTYERGLRLASALPGSVLRGAADMHVGIAGILHERGDLAGATRHLQRSEELGEHLGLPKNRYRWRVAMARVREAEGDLDAALELLDEAERVYVADFAPDVRPIAAQRARVWLAQGRFADAAAWAREEGPSAHDDLSYLHEFAHITLARVLLARDRHGREAGNGGDGLDLLRRLLAAAEAGGRTGTVIEILVLQAVAHQARGDVRGAILPLERALTLAEPEGHVRVFLDEGVPMERLLRAAVDHRVASEHARRLLAPLDPASDGSGGRSPQSLVEPLSDRERDVLRLLRTELTGPEIARELVVSVNTVRTHTRSIYAKLGVTNRRAAVLRAQELDLSTRSRDRRS